jgi:hypothetical protein
MNLLSLSIEIVEGLLLFIIAERTKQSINSPLISAKGTEEISFPCLFFQ